MSLLVWNDKFATGIPEVDREHRRLFELINDLARQRASGAGTGELCRVLDELREYTVYHFQYEENLMRVHAVSDAHRELHCTAHRGFIEHLAKASELIHSHSREVIDHLLAFLVKWLVFHISGVDVRLAHEINNTRSGAAAGQVIAQEYLLEQEALVHTAGELLESLGLLALETVELNSQLQHEIEQRHHSEEELKLAEVVYSHCAEGMVVTDAHNLIVAVNPAFTTVTGYAAHEVLGKNPSLLRSGRHGMAFYEEMWHSINTTNGWAGEIWNRRKDGQEYAEWLSISVIRNPDQSVDRYVALFTDITEKKLADRIIQNQADYDPMTQLPNRRLFQDCLEQEIQRAGRSGLCLALLVVDLDRFKEVNDTLGHHSGDLLLIEAARRITDCLSAPDMAARLGGDEFAVILSDFADRSRIEPLAQSLLQALREPFRLKRETAYISASIGITVYPGDAGDAQTLMMNADHAMYVAKSSGRNCFSYFSDTLLAQSVARQQMLRDMREALALNQFCMHFQPIVDLATGRILKAEALIRWNHPERGMIGPAEFIPLAEEYDLIGQIGRFVLKESLYWANRWTALSPQGFQISVNKSPAQFHSRENEQDSWLDHILASDTSSNSIVIEITEGLLLKADASARDKLTQFREAGIQVAIDDFGTGYSALSYLRNMDVDYLKIDQSFVRNMTRGSNDVILSEAIIMMAHRLGLKVIAEGVETEEQLSLLAAAGCDYVQGFLYSTPLPPEALEDLLRDNWAGLDTPIRESDLP